MQNTATATASEILAVPIAEFDISKLKLSEVQQREWSWTDATGLRQTKKKTFVNVNYNDKSGLYLSLPEGSRTNGGVKVSQNYKTGFMSLNLSENHSSELRSVDAAFGDLIFANAAKLLPSKVKMLQSRNVIDVLMRGLVQNGGIKGTGISGETEYWQDQITATIPTKRFKQQCSVDLKSLTIEDRNGVPIASDQLAGKTFKEVVLHVQSLNIEPDTVRLQCSYRYLVVDEVAIQKVVTRRKLEQREIATKCAAEESSETATKGDANTYKPPYTGGKPVASMGPSTSIAQTLTEETQGGKRSSEEVDTASKPSKRPKVSQNRALSTSSAKETPV
jgi:hypothetical protein